MMFGMYLLSKLSLGLAGWQIRCIFGFDKGYVIVHMLF